MTRVLRFDAGTLQSARRTSQGYLRVDGWASRVGIQEYRNPDGSIRRELREPDAVFSDESLTGFEGAPITDDHPSEMVDLHNAKDLTKGHVLSVGRRDGDHVAVSMVVTDPALIAKMEAGKRQLSTGYYVELDETPGVHPQFGRYDARQVRVGPVNHLAVVERGRAGTARVRMDAAMDVHFDNVLDQDARDKIADKNFAAPGGKLPIENAEHVRAAMARFGQTDFKDAAEKKTAFHKIVARAKEEGIDSSGFEDAWKGRLDALSAEDAARLDALDRQISLMMDKKRKDYSEDQPRDEHGRFGSGGGGGGDKGSKNEFSLNAVPPKPPLTKTEAAKPPVEMGSSASASKLPPPTERAGAPTSGAQKAPTPPATPSTAPVAPEKPGTAQPDLTQRTANGTKTPTYPKAREAVLNGLAAKGWTVKKDLKIPHATSPNGQTRLWFKPQAMWVSRLGGGHSSNAHAHTNVDPVESHSLKDARSTFADIRHYSNDEGIAKIHAHYSALGRREHTHSDGTEDAFDLTLATSVPHSDSPAMDLEAALAKIKELEAKLAALQDQGDDDGDEGRTDAAEKARLEGERDAARKDAEDAKAEAEKARKDADELVTKKVRESLDVLTKARAVLGTDAKITVKKDDADVEVELVDAPLRAVKCAVVKHVDGREIAAEKHDAYVEAMFEYALDNHAKRQDAAAKGADSLAAARAAVTQTAAVVKTDAADASVDPEKAAAEQIKARLANAWQSTDK